MADYKGRSGRYTHREEGISPELQRQIEGTQLVTKPCAKNAGSILESRSPGYPACARQHPGLLDTAYCRAAEPDQVQAVGRRPICYGIGKELGTVTVDGRRKAVYECDLAARLRDAGLLKNIPRESTRTEAVERPSAPERKTFWQRLLGS